MMDTSPAWLIENPRSLLFVGSVANGGVGGGGEGTGNESLQWRHPRDSPREAPQSSPPPTLSRDQNDHEEEGVEVVRGDGQIEFNIGFDVNNSLILITLAICLAVYLAVIVFLMVRRWWGGRKPLYILKWPPTSIKSTNPYLVTIVTGLRKDAGTDGTFVFSIHGLNHSSDQYFVNGRTVHHDRKLLSNCGSDAFLITCDEPLGNISEATVTLWATDTEEKLFLNYMTIQDIKRNVFTYLPLHKWIHASNAGSEEMVIQAKHEKTFSQALDNITCAFRERNIWVAPWLSTTLGSKLDSVYTATLCYLTITCLMLAAAIFFYTSSYSKHGYVTSRAVVFIVIAAVIITCIGTLFHVAMRLIRVGAGDFAERYTPVLLRDMSASPHVHWDVDADKNDPVGSSPRRRKKLHRRKVADPDGNAQRNNSNPDEVPVFDRKRPSTASGHRVSFSDRQANNNNRDIFQAFPGSACPPEDDAKPCFAPQSGEKSCFVPSAGDDNCETRDSFTKTRFNGGAGFLPLARSMNMSPTYRSSAAQGPSFNYSAKDPNPLGAWKTLTRTASGFGAYKGPPTVGPRIGSRRYDSYLDVGGGCGAPSTGSRNDCPVFPVFPQTLSTSTGPPATRTVAFKCPMDADDDVCSRYFARTSNSDPRGLICGGPSSLPRSDDWRMPLGNDTRFSSRSYGQPSRVRPNDVRIFRNRCAYEDNCWNMGGDTMNPREDYTERSVCQGMASTKRFSFPRQGNDGMSMGRFGSNRPAAANNCDPCFGLLPTMNPMAGGQACGGAQRDPCDFQTERDPCNFQTQRDPCDFQTERDPCNIQKDPCNFQTQRDPCNFQTERDPCNFQNDPCRTSPCNFQGDPCRMNQGADVERSWNALWNSVKPPRGGDAYSGMARGDQTICKTSGAEVSGPVLTEMRGFAGQLVENIIAKIKKQLTSPEQNVDLADCEMDIESFVRRMSKRMVGAGGAFTCDMPVDPCGGPPLSPQRFQEGRGGSPDPLSDRIGQAVTDGTLKSSLAMLDDRVATIVKDVEKVRANIIERMRQELGLAPEEGQGKEFRGAGGAHGGGGRARGGGEGGGRVCGVSASDTSVMMTKGGKSADKYGSNYLPRDDISQAMTEAKLNKVARSSLENVLNRDGMETMRDNMKTTTEGDLKNFANDVVQSLYLAVRTKLQQMLKHEYDLADDGTVPFPTEELLKKADLEVQEQVLPTVVEHIVWLMKEEAKVMGQLDCDMMMIAFAGQYVDTIVTNAVLKTHVDLSQKRAYTRTFVVTSNSNKTNSNSAGNNNNNNNNNNNLDSMLNRCLSETKLSMQTLASLSATRVEVEEVLRGGETCVHGSAGAVDAELSQMQILCSLVERFIVRLRMARGGAVDTTVERGTAVKQVGGDAEELETWKEEKELETCPYCRAEAAQCVVARCLTPISARLITDLILEEATKNLDACGRIVESNLVHCNQETMVALGRALLDGSSRTGEHLFILESVTADLKAVALDQATVKVVDDLMAIGDASRAEAEMELRRRLTRFTEDARRKTDRIMMRTAIRENHQQNNSHLKVDFHPSSENNINYNAAKPTSKDAAAAEGDPPRPGEAQNISPDRPEGGGGVKGNPNDADTEVSDRNPNKHRPDDDNIVDEMIGIRNSLTRIADEDECLTGRCRHHRGRLSRALPTSLCDALHYGDMEFPDEQSRSARTNLTQTLNEIEGTSLSDMWRDPTDFRHRCLLFLGNLVLGGVFLLVASLVIGCIVLGLQLTPAQAGLWLLLALVGVALQALLLEPIKVFVLGVYYTLFRNDLVQ